MGYFPGAAAAEAAEAYFIQVFQRRELPDDMPAFTLSTPTSLVDVIYDAGMAPSKGEIRRLIKQGGVRLDGEKVEDIHLELQLKAEQIVQVGKRHFLRVIAAAK